MAVIYRTDIAQTAGKTIIDILKGQWTCLHEHSQSHHILNLITVTDRQCYIRVHTSSTLFTLEKPIYQQKRESFIYARSVLFVFICCVSAIS